ncbi:MAG: Asp-tRNA(Asn)/Glu-tRNA(Gln) amidotransferase subunit GatB, partial [Coriobacteriaceae bacterium]|nr:Asp-tRNA(Asn)/Glu-tRNA(Gln) amidotransferase subunit GatB [Coriobacteriaceae bacterium]
MKTLHEVLKDWEAVIGLEVHTELTTLNTKMFCGCKLEFGAAPNTHTCPVCLGLPGSLPVPNKAAIESIVLAGLATNCEIEKESMFYRKNYTYPDISSNFQITQGPVAFCMRGWMDLEVDGVAAKERVDLAEAREQGSYTTRIGITRIHMEEDAGKLNHVGSTDGRIAGATHSLVDYNRCSTPLIELVTEPDFRTPEEARLFMQKLRQIYLSLGISDCSMEEGSLRCDGNISLRRRGESRLGTKTELKNMNSFKNLHDGLVYEICRQAEVLEEGGIIYQETRHWDPTARHTIMMRLKETADDYRYFPEPNLTPFVLSDAFIEGIRTRLPELPDEKAKRFGTDFELSAYDVRHLVEHRSTSNFFEACIEAAGAGAGGAGAGTGDVGGGAAEANAGGAASAKPLAKPLANLIINDVAGYLNANDGIDLADTALTPARAVELVRLLVDETISSKQAKEVFAASL